jgi:hypothetical protein
MLNKLTTPLSDNSAKQKSDSYQVPNYIVKNSTVSLNKHNAAYGAMYNNSLSNRNKFKSPSIPSHSIQNKTTPIKKVMPSATLIKQLKPSAVNSTASKMPSTYMPHSVRNIYMPNNQPYAAPMGVPLLPLYGYDSSDELDKDIENIKLLYPKSAKLIYSQIMEECDKLEYDGSMMFDEYPDKVMTEQILDNIYEKVKNMEEYTQVELSSFTGQRRYRQNYFRDIINILLLNEFINRRRRYRSRKRWF